MVVGRHVWASSCKEKVYWNWICPFHAFPLSRQAKKANLHCTKCMILLHHDIQGVRYQCIYSQRWHYWRSFCLLNGQIRFQPPIHEMLPGFLCKIEITETLLKRTSFSQCTPSPILNIIQFNTFEITRSPVKLENT